MPYCRLHIKQNQTNQKSEVPAKEIVKIKFGLDVLAHQFTLCRQIGHRTPQPSLKMNWDKAFKVIKDSGDTGIELHSCYEAGPFGYHLHRTLEEIGVTNIIITPERLDPRWTLSKEKQRCFKRAAVS